jgi:hypothetical protein
MYFENKNWKWRRKGNVSGIWDLDIRYFEIDQLGST